eukprot:479192_1
MSQSKKRIKVTSSYASKDFYINVERAQVFTIEDVLKRYEKETGKIWPGLHVKYSYKYGADIDTNNPLPLAQAVASLHDTKHGYVELYVHYKFGQLLVIKIGELEYVKDYNNVAQSFGNRSKAITLRSVQEKLVNVMDNMDLFKQYALWYRGRRLDDLDEALSRCIGQHWWHLSLKTKDGRQWYNDREKLASKEDAEYKDPFAELVDDMNASMNAHNDSEQANDKPMIAEIEASNRYDKELELAIHLSQYTTQIDALNQQISQLTNDNTQLTNDNTQLTNDNTQKAIHLTQSEQTINDLQNVTEMIRRSGKKQRKTLATQNEQLRQRISELEDERKEFEMTIDALKEENKRLKLQHLDTDNYEQWSADEVVHWMVSVDQQIYTQYEEKLKAFLKQEEVNGECLVDVEHSDIKRWGISNFKHAKQLLKSIKLLVHKKDDNTQILNEGAPTAYI